MARPSSTDKRADPLRYLPPGALATLASILCYPTSSCRDTQPSREWLTQQRSRIEALPRSLRLNRSLSLATFFTLDHAVSGRLCAHHRDLKPELLFWCYAQLNEEATTHVDQYRRYRRRFPTECTDELGEYIDRVTGVATLYLGRDDFEAEYGRYALREEDRYRRVRGGCAACVLSVVGARAQMLIDLRASMLARKKRKTPRLLALIEAWMDAFPTGTLEMRLESEAIAEELRRFRERIAELRGKGGEGQGGNRHKKRERRRRRRHQRGYGMSRAIAEFFGWRLGHKKKERHGSGSGRDQSGSRRGSSSHHSSSPHRSESSGHCDSSSKAGSTYSAYSSSSRPNTVGSERPQSESADRCSSRPVSRASHTQVWDDGRSSKYSYYGPSNITAHEDDILDDAAQRGSRYDSPLSRSRTSFAHQDVSKPSPSSSSRYSTNPYQRSFPSNSRPESTTSVNTIRPEPTTASRSSKHTRPVFDSTPGQARYTWTSRCASSIYSTDANGLRAGDEGFRARGNEFAVRHSEPQLERVVENLELGEEDVPLDPDGYDEIHCPSSDSEDGDDDEEDDEAEEEEEQYVGARAGWGKGKQPDTAGSAARLCPVCQGDLAGLTSEEANAHCKSCVGGRPTSAPSRNGKPTVSGIGRMVDEVIDGIGHLSTIDEAAAQFTPRPSVAAHVRRDYDGRPRDQGSVRRDRVDGGRSKGLRTSYAPSSVAMGVSGGDLSPDDSVSVCGKPVRSQRETRRDSALSGGGSANRRSALSGGKFRHVVRDR